MLKTLQDEEYIKKILEDWDRIDQIGQPCIPSIIAGNFRGFWLCNSFAATLQRFVLFPCQFPLYSEFALFLISSVFDLFFWGFRRYTAISPFCKPIPFRYDDLPKNRRNPTVTVIFLDLSYRDLDSDRRRPSPRRYGEFSATRPRLRTLLPWARPFSLESPCVMFTTTYPFVAWHHTLVPR